MYLLTSLSLTQLSRFIKDKKITLRNTDLFIQPNSEGVTKYFDTLMGNNGFVLGIAGVPLDEKTLAMFKELTKDPDMVVLEVTINPKDAEMFSINGLDKVAECVYYDMSQRDIVEHLNAARLPAEVASSCKRPVIGCIPLLTGDFKIRVAAVDPEVALEVTAQNITVVRVNKEVNDAT